jgi:sulfur relay (sulfurtransferase) DsrF/TusC family protein
MFYDRSKTSLVVGGYCSSSDSSSFVVPLKIRIAEYDVSLLSAFRNDEYLISTKSLNLILFSLKNLLIRTARIQDFALRSVLSKYGKVLLVGVPF